MAIAIQSQSKHSSKVSQFINLNIDWLSSPFQRLWWHINAYAVIIGIMILAVINVVVLYGYEQLQALRLIWQRRMLTLPEQSPELSISIKQRH